MKHHRAAAVAAVLLIVAAVGIAGSLLRPRAAPVPGPRPQSARPPLMVLTTLPILFPERFALNAPASPVLKALEPRYRSIAISVADAGELDHGHLLLMAQPQAQPPEDLVALDDWVRRGGRVLLLADPALEWRSERALGSLLRPPFSFADTGLLAHWGLQLAAPERLGPATLQVDGRRVRTQSPGTLTATGENCAVDADRAMARCRIGSGAVTVVADADFLDPSDPADTADLDILLIELSRLEQ